MKGSLRPSLAKGLLLRLGMGGATVLSFGVVVALVFVVVALLARSTVKKDPPVIPDTHRQVVVQGGQGDTKPPDEPKQQQVTSQEDKEKQNLNKIKNRIVKDVTTAGERFRRMEVARQTPDSANHWIWIHIAEGNYTSSVYRSEKGYNSFKQCMNDVNPNVIGGTELYKYNFNTGEAIARTASQPEVTGRSSGSDGQTLLVAIMHSDPDKNKYRLEMLEDILAHRRCDVNMHFGPRGDTALMDAVSRGDTDSIKILLKHHAHPTVKDLDNNTALTSTQSDRILDLLKKGVR